MVRQKLEISQSLVKTKIILSDLQGNVAAKDIYSHLNCISYTFSLYFSNSEKKILKCSIYDSNYVVNYIMQHANDELKIVHERFKGETIST